MKRKTYVLVLVAAAVLAVLAISMRTERGGMMHRLVGAVHGR